MKHSTRLADLLQSTLGLHRARTTCPATLIIALFKVKTVNLSQLTTTFPGTASIDSNYQRLQRFFQLARFLLAFLPDAPCTLALDRTQWMLGRIPINFLLLSASMTVSPFLFPFSSWPEGAIPIPRSVSSCPVNSLPCLVATRSTAWWPTGSSSAPRGSPG